MSALWLGSRADGTDFDRLCLEANGLRDRRVWCMPFGKGLATSDGED